MEEKERILKEELQELKHFCCRKIINESKTIEEKN